MKCRAKLFVLTSVSFCVILNAINSIIIDYFFAVNNRFILILLINLALLFSSFQIIPIGMISCHYIKNLTEANLMMIILGIINSLIAMIFNCNLMYLQLIVIFLMIVGIVFDACKK